MEAPEKKKCKEQTVISMKHTGAHDEIGQVYHQLYEWASRNNVTASGPGLTIFLSPPSELDPGSSVFEVCLPVPPETMGDAQVAVRTLPACTIASITVKGPYSDIPAHYSEMLAWLSAEGWPRAGPPREVYLKRPDAKGGGDPSEFLTEIQFPIKE